MKTFVPVLKSFSTIDADGANNYSVSADLNGANILTISADADAVKYVVDAHITAAIQHQTKSNSNFS